MQRNSGHFIADGNAINVNVGFVPDYIRAIAKLEETNQVTYEWFKELANTANANGQFGIVRAANGGAVVLAADADNGFQTYDESADKVLVPAANGDGDAETTVTDWTEAVATAATARSTTALGTVIRPTTHNGFVYECITAGTSSGTEPTFNTTIGGSTTDGTVVFITREEKTIIGGAKGFTVGATISTDTDEWVWIAEKHDRVKAEQDAASFDPVNNQ